MIYKGFHTYQIHSCGMGIPARPIDSCGMGIPARPNFTDFLCIVLNQKPLYFGSYFYGFYFWFGTSSG